MPAGATATPRYLTTRLLRTALTPSTLAATSPARAFLDAESTKPLSWSARRFLGWRPLGGADQAAVRSGPSAGHALEPVRQGVRRHFGAIGEDVAALVGRMAAISIDRKRGY